MYEELLNENEVHPEQIFPKIHIGKAAGVDGETLWTFIGSLPDKKSELLKEQLIQVANAKENLQELMKELMLPGKEFLLQNRR